MAPGKVTSAAELESHHLIEDSDEHAAPDAATATTTTTTWLRLATLFVMAVLCGGLLPGQAVFNEMFAAAGLAREQCDAAGEAVPCDTQILVISDIMTGLAMFISLLYLPAGLMFDVVGGQRSAVLGAGLLAVGLLILVPLMSGLVPVAYELWVFGLGVALTDIGSITQNMAFFSFLFHLPGWQTVLLSLANCCYQVSSFLPLILKAIMYSADANLATVLSGYTIAVTASAGICYAVVPSQKEYRRQAMLMLGMPLPMAPAPSAHRIKRSLSDGARVLWLDAREHLLVAVPVVLGTAGTFIYTTLTVPMGTEIFGTQQDGERLADKYNLMNGLLGLAVGPVSGILADKLGGMQGLVLGVALSFGVVAGTASFADWNAQLVAVVAVALANNVMWLFQTRYIVRFAPPNHLGAVQGMYFAGITLFFMPPAGALLVYMQLTNTFVLPMMVFMTAACLAWLAYAVRMLFVTPWPDTPPMLPEDEAEIAQGFWVGNLEDAAFVVKMEKKELMALLSSSNVLDQRRLMLATTAPGVGLRILKLARQHSSGAWRANPTLPARLDGDTDVVFGHPDSSLGVLELAFNGMGNRPGGMEWTLSPLGGPSDSRRREFIHYTMALACAGGHQFGILLELREPGSGAVVAACVVFPPGAHEHGYAVPVGSERWYSVVDAVGLPVAFADRERFGEMMLQRFMALGMAKLAMVEKRAARAPLFWYVEELAVHPAHQGKGYGKRLLAVVAAWADAGKQECCLECEQQKMPFFKRAGYKVAWTHSVIVENEADGESKTPPLKIFEMVRKPQRAALLTPGRTKTVTYDAI